MDGWRCLSCDSGSPADTRWCGQCGLARPDAGALWTCGACSAANVLGARYCGHCGSRHTTTPHVEERREVTALFADISGFTTLADRVEDAEALHDIINPVIAGMAAIAERYEGFVAKYAGDALLVFFGAPVAHEDDAARALHVALEMHAALPELLDT
ncbi:MAG TPA: adenylate/guanylate cyclase domain-containing protein, partial [Acidimicrobiales bacterium]|nr:adenylate/guanylate cyclase domain-containing protein [Acidimicrobiales bacterium]